MAQSDGADGSLSRTYYRIQAVQAILSRLSDKGEEEEVEGGWRKEFDWAHLKIQLDNERYVMCFEDQTDTVQSTQLSVLSTSTPMS